MSVVYVAGSARAGVERLGRALAADPDLLVVDVRALLLDPVAAACWSAPGDFLDRALRLPSIRAAAVSAFGARGVPALAGVALGLRRTPDAARTVVDRLQSLGRLAGDRRLVDVSGTAPGMLLWPMAGHRVVLAHLVASPDVAPRTLVDHVATLAGSRLARCTRVAVPAHALRADPARVAAALQPTPAAPDLAAA